MKFLHTADLHLKKGEEERIEILKWLIKKADELKADIFIIAGDLFESDTDATILRPELRKNFETTDIKFLIIPGNHDTQSFSQDYDYGENVIQLIQKPFEIIELDELKICAVPYQNKKFSEYIRDIPSDIDILIAHGTLYDQSFIFSMLDDKETEYMPIYPENLENLARYVALGHLHSRNIEKDYKGTKAIYPGSPIALDTKCIGERYFYLVNIDEKEIKVDSIKIEISPYWVEKEYFIFPGIEEKTVKQIESYLYEIDNSNIMPNITIKGFIGEKDRDFEKEIDAMNNKFKNKFRNLRINPNIQSWDIIIQNRMVKNFVEKTAELDNTLRMKIFEITFPVFSEALK